MKNKSAQNNSFSNKRVVSFYFVVPQNSINLFLLNWINNNPVPSRQNFIILCDLLRLLYLSQNTNNIKLLILNRPDQQVSNSYSWIFRFSNNIDIRYLFKDGVSTEVKFKRWKLIVFTVVISLVSNWTFWYFIYTVQLKLILEFISCLIEKESWYFYLWTIYQLHGQHSDHLIRIFLFKLAVI